MYGTFADDFVSLFALAPKNTILVYSYSKYFGATGWRLGTIATHRDNVLDKLIAELPKDAKKQLHERYESITTEPDKLKFIDRLVADSRTVALNHTAGLSTPQQVQMVLFSLFSLMDTPDAYKNALKRLIRKRKQALYEEVGISFEDDDPNQVDYYTILDLEFLGERMFGREFVEWLLEEHRAVRIAVPPRARSARGAVAGTRLRHAASFGTGVAREPERVGLSADRPRDAQADRGVCRALQRGDRQEARQDQGEVTRICASARVARVSIVKKLAQSRGSVNDRSSGLASVTVGEAACSFAL